MRIWDSIDCIVNYTDDALLLALIWLTVSTKQPATRGIPPSISDDGKMKINSPCWLLFSSLLFSEGYPVVQDPLTWLDIGIWRSLFLNSQFSHMKIIIGFCIYFASPSFLSFESFDGMSLLLFSLPTTHIRRPSTPEAKYLTFSNTLVLIVKRYMRREIGEFKGIETAGGRSRSQSVFISFSLFLFPFSWKEEKEKKLADLSCAVLCLIPGPLNRNVSRILSSHIPPTDLILYHVFSGFKKKERKKRVNSASSLLSAKMERDVNSIAMPSAMCVRLCVEEGKATSKRVIVILSEFRAIFTPSPWISCPLLLWRRPVGLCCLWPFAQFNSTRLDSMRRHFS